MKKKISIFLSIILIVSSALFASATSRKYKHEITNSLALQAGYEEVYEFSVSPIAAQSQSFVIGMPFNIEDAYIQHKEPTSQGNTPDGVMGSGTGRTIANWSMLFNTPVDISISAEPLKHVKTDISDHDSSPLTFSLAFDCNLSFYKADGSLDTLNIYIIYNGDDKTTHIYCVDHRHVFPEFGTVSAYNSVSFKDLFDTDKHSRPTDGSYLGNATGLVLIGLTKEASEIITAAKKQSNGGYEYDPTEGSYYLPEGDYEANVTITLTPNENASWEV